MTSPKDPHLLSGAYALDAVSGEEAAAFEEALHASEELRGEAAELTDTAVVLGLSVAPEQPPAALRARLLDLIEQTPQLPAEGEADEDETPAEGPPPEQAAPVMERTPRGAHTAPARRRRIRRPALLLALAAVAVLLFGGGLLVDRMVLEPGTAQGPTAFVRITSAADVQHSRAAVAGGGTATAYWSPSLDESAIVLNGVQHPSGRSLQLWVVTDGSARSAGLYRPAPGQHYEIVNSALGPEQRFAVSVEPAGGSKQPTTTPIVVLPAA